MAIAIWTNGAEFKSSVKKLRLLRSQQIMSS